MPKNTDQSLEQKLWASADKLRKNMDAAEYKHIVLGLIFLKYISDAFEEKRASLQREFENPKSEWYIREPRERYEALNEREEYRAENVFYVAKQARWPHLQSVAKQPEIGKYLDEAMDAVERENGSLKGVLPKVYARPNLDKASLGSLIDLIGTMTIGDAEARSQDLLGRVYEYFLGQFALAEGRKGGQFYTPQSIVKLLVEMLEPYEGRVFDPCCGSGGMFVQSEKFVERHADHVKQEKNGLPLHPRDRISIYGQESNQTTWRLCKMNLAIRNIDASNVKWNSEGSFLKDVHPDLKADFILANPPFNDSDWAGELLREDARWKYGVPPVGNANFAWVQHFIYHLAPTGSAGFVLSNGSLSSNTGGEGEIRKNIVEDDLVDCIVMLPTQLFYNTGIPACLWFVSRYKNGNKERSRKGEVLFIDASEMGAMINRRNRILTDDDIRTIADTYHAWKSIGRSQQNVGAGSVRAGSKPAPMPNQNVGAGSEPAPTESVHVEYHDVKGFCKSATLEEIRKHNYVLTPGRYVGIPDEEDDLPAPRPDIFFVYAILCDNDSLYIGQTDNIPRRWQEHLSGKAAQWTKRHKPRYIAHFEEFKSREEAVAREKELKTTAGRRWLKKAIAEGRARQAGGVPFEERMAKLTSELKQQMQEGRRLDGEIKKQLAKIGFRLE